MTMLLPFFPLLFFPLPILIALFFIAYLFPDGDPS